MGRRYLPLSMLLVLCSMLTVRAYADTRYFRGVLEDQLSVAGDHWSAWTWHAATTSEVRRLGLKPAEVTAAFAGECRLPDDPKRPVHGRIVELKDGRWIAYLDVNRDGTFGPGESAPFEAPPAGSSVNAQARLLLPLPDGPYREMPVLVALPTSHTAVPPNEPGTQRVLIGTDTFVEGHAEMPFGSILMRFSYNVGPHDPAAGTLDATTSQEWMDLNRDGLIDATPGSPEVGDTAGAAPVFHVKDLYVQTTKLDAETRTFTLKTVPGKEYRRIAMGVGDRLPDFEFHTFADRKRHLSDIKGTYRLLNFWTTWCRPCVEELPTLKATYDRYHDQGFEIVGMNADEDTDKAEKLLDRFDIQWPQAKLDQEMIDERLQITAWPTKVLIDRHGKVVALVSGDKDLEETLHRLLQ